MDDTGRAPTVREVYEIVGRVDGKLDALSNQLATLNLGAEHRFTQLESGATDAQGRLQTVEAHVDDLRTAHAVARGHLKVLAWALGAFLTLTAGGLATALAHVAHW